MIFSPPLRSATLIKRYKRFLADVITPEGETFTLHCANTGANGALDLRQHPARQRAGARGDRT